MRTQNLSSRNRIKTESQKRERSSGGRSREATPAVRSKPSQRAGGPKHRGAPADEDRNP
jgi:hypothetical protein